MPQLQQRVASTFLSHYLFSNTQDLSEVNVVSTFYTIQVGRACSMADVQHPSHMTDNQRMVYGVLLLTVTKVSCLGQINAYHH